MCGAAAMNQADLVPELPDRNLFRSHWTEWALFLVLIGLEIVCHLVTPYKRYVGAPTFANQAMMYPYKSNTVPNQALPVIALVIPLSFILTHFCCKRNVRDLHHAILGLLTTVALTAVITDAIKDGIGRPRPHFYARCFGSPQAKPAYDATGNVLCVTAPSLMKEAYRSFPSGHTSWSFAGLGYLAMYVAGKLRGFHHEGQPWTLFIIVLPLLDATVVAITRVDDCWHDWTDVSAGAAIGLLSAHFCYRQHFPSLLDEHRMCWNVSNFPNSLVGTHGILPATKRAGTQADHGDHRVGDGCKRRDGDGGEEEGEHEEERESWEDE